MLLGAATPDAGSVSPLIIANANNGEFTFAGAGGGAPTAAQATGAVARATVEEDKDLVAVLNARAGRAARSMPSSAHRACAAAPRPAKGAIDPAGAGLALLAVGR